jgi:hypothetical protein
LLLRRIAAALRRVPAARIGLLLRRIAAALGREATARIGLVLLRRRGVAVRRLAIGRLVLRRHRIGRSALLLRRIAASIVGLLLRHRRRAPHRCVPSLLRLDLGLAVSIDDLTIIILVSITTTTIIISFRAGRALSWTEPWQPPLTELRGIHSSIVPAATYLEMGSRLRVSRSLLENLSQSGARRGRSWPVRPRPRLRLLLLQAARANDVQD